MLRKITEISEAFLDGTQRKPPVILLPPYAVGRKFFHLIVILFLWTKSSRSWLSMNCFLPPGNRTTGMSPAHILSLKLQTDKPSHAAASFSGNNRGALGLSIQCAFTDAFVWLGLRVIVPTLCLWFSPFPFPFSGGQNFALEQRNECAVYKHFSLRIKPNVSFLKSWVFLTLPLQEISYSIQPQSFLPC